MVVWSCLRLDSVNFKPYTGNYSPPVFLNKREKRGGSLVVGTPWGCQGLFTQSSTTVNNSGTLTSPLERVLHDKTKWTGKQKESSWIKNPASWLDSTNYCWWSRFNQGKSTTTPGYAGTTHKKRTKLYLIETTRKPVAHSNTSSSTPNSKVYPK